MKINNEWFFILDKLQIKPAERFFVSSLIVLLALLWMVEPYFGEESIYNDAYYAPIVEEFYNQASNNYRKRKETLQRYYPGDEDQILAYASKSLPSGVDILMKEQIIDRASVDMDLINGGNNTEMITEPNSMHADTIPKSKKEQVSTKINLNEAKVTDLMKLPGIGYAIAQRIVDYRNENGEFKTVTEIMKVKGIGPAKFEKMQELIEV